MQRRAVGLCGVFGVIWFSVSCGGSSSATNGTQPISAVSSSATATPATVVTPPGGAAPSQPVSTASAPPASVPETSCTTLGQRLLEVSAEQVSNPQQRMGRLTSFVGLLPGNSEDGFTEAATKYRSCATSVFNSFNTQADERLASLKSEGLQSGALDAHGTFAYQGSGLTRPENAEPEKFKSLMTLIDNANVQDAEIIKQLDAKVLTECGADPTAQAVQISFVRGELQVEPVDVNSIKRQLIVPWRMYGNYGRAKGDGHESYKDIAPSKLEIIESTIAAPRIDDATTRNQLVCRLQFSMEGSFMPVTGKGSWNKETSEISFVPDRQQ